MATSAEILAQACRHYAERNLILAEQHSWSLLSEQPNHAEALHLLGRIAHQRGDHARALDYLNRSLIHGRTDATVWKTLGDVHLAAGDFSAAAADYQEALRLQPDFADAFNSLGIALCHLDDWHGACRSFQEALCRAPSSAQVYNNLGHALQKLRKWGEAVEAYEQALRLWPGNADICCNLGHAYYGQGELDQAVHYYRQAASLGSAHAGDVCTSLGNALKEQGLLDQAIAQYQEALRLEPDHAMAAYHLSELAAAGKYCFKPEELQRIKHLASSERGPVFERSLGAFALANVLDRQGDYDQAFAYYRQANELRKSLEGNLAFDAAAHAAVIERICASHGRSYFERVKRWGTHTDLPIFIVGMPRSGSTLVEQILASHPKVCGAGEIDSLYWFIRPFTTDKDLYRDQLVPNVRLARKLASDYLGYLARLGKGATRVTNKNLGNFLHLGIIATLFPRARVIHCRRDPLDVCLSCYFQNFREIGYAWSLEDIGTYYRSYEKLMAHWSRVLPLQIHEVCYEDLVHKQEAVSRALVAFCGLDWDDRCLTFWHTRRPVRTLSSVQVRKPLSARAIGRWRHYHSHLEPLFQALGRSVEPRTSYLSEAARLAQPGSYDGLVKSNDPA